MIRSSHILTLALGAVLTAGVAGAGEQPSLARGLVGLGSGVQDARRPQSNPDAPSPVVHAHLDDADRSRGRVEQTLGAISVDYMVPERVPEDELDDVGQTAPMEFPEAIAPAETRAVPLETMLGGDDLGVHDRVHEFLTRRTRTEQRHDVDAAGVIAAEFRSDEQDDPAATVQLSDDQLPPAPPPSAGLMSGPDTPRPAAAASPVEAPPAIPSAPLTTGFIDPRYELSAESSIYVWTCQRCGRTDCHCVYAPFGEAVRSAFGQQIHLGSARLMTLYAYDFLPEGTPRQTELTSRGEYQLEKIVSRLQYTPSRIKIEASGNDTLDAARRMRVLQALGAMGIDNADGMVVTVRTDPGRPAVELLESSYDLLESIRERGQTLQGGGTATFSGATRFGQ